MALVFFSWTTPSGTAQDLLLDASPGRTHTATAQVTEHPVEKGGPVTDYIRPLPRRLTVEGFITNTPIGPPPVASSVAASGAGIVALRDGGSDVGGGAGINAEVTNVTFYPPVNYIRGPRPPISVVALDFLESFDRVQVSFLALVKAIADGALFSISTSLSDYTNMAAVSMTVTETPSAAQSMNFSIEFQELRIVSTQVVAVPARKKRDNVGPKVPPAASTEQAKKIEQSMLSVDVQGPDAP